MIPVPEALHAPGLYNATLLPKIGVAAKLGPTAKETEELA